MPRFRTRRIGMITIADAGKHSLSIQPISDDAGGWIRLSKVSLTPVDLIGEGHGLKILSVLDDSLASKAGLNRDDTIVQIYGRQLQSVSDLRKALIDARDDGADSIKVRLIRVDTTIDLEIAFDVAPGAAPKVPLPKGDLPVVPAPQGFNELDALADHFADLEAKLDDACVRITSDFGEEKSRPITGTRVRGTRWVVS